MNFSVTKKIEMEQEEVMVNKKMDGKFSDLDYVYTHYQH